MRAWAVRAEKAPARLELARMMDSALLHKSMLVVGHGPVNMSSLIGVNQDVQRGFVTDGYAKQSLTMVPPAGCHGPVRHH